METYQREVTVTIVDGSDGFIGTHLCNILTHFKNREVLCIDEKHGYSIDALVNSDYDFSKVVSIYHLAGISDARCTDAELLRLHNIEAFEKICDLSYKHQIPLVYASSAEAYEMNKPGPYGISKRKNEIYASTNPFATGVRMYNAYGTDPRPGTILYYLLTRDDVTLYNEGKCWRYYTWIDDIINGLLWASGCNYPLVNLANPIPVTSLELAELVKQYRSELQINLDFTPDKNQYIDLSLPCYETEFITIDEGLKKIWQSSHTHFGVNQP